MPSGSNATLSGTATVKPTFVADIAGSYALSLVVNDGKVNSTASTVTITASVGNAAPVANAGMAQNVLVGATVMLDGSNSSDANGDLISYNGTSLISLYLGSTIAHTWGALNGIPPSGFWALKNSSGQQLATFDLSWESPFDSLNKPKILIPSVYALTDNSGIVQKVYVNWYRYSATGFTQVTDLAKFFETVSSMSIQIVPEGSTGGDNKAYNLIPGNLTVITPTVPVELNRCAVI